MILVDLHCSLRWKKRVANYLGICVDINVAISGSEEQHDDVIPEVYDRVFAVNYLSHFLLVYELLPLLIRSSPSRIVSVTSIAHAFIKTPLLNFDSQSQQSRSFCENLVGYDASKLAMVLHIKELSRILGGKKFIIGFIAFVIEQTSNFIHVNLAN